MFKVFSKNIQMVFEGWDGMIELEKYLLLLYFIILVENFKIIYYTPTYDIIYLFKSLLKNLLHCNVKLLYESKVSFWIEIQ